MKKGFNIISKIISWLMIIVVIASISLFMGTRVFGLQVFVVLSGSMEPEYSVGSIICAKHIDEKDIDVGDVIVFDIGGGSTATHRVNDIVVEDGFTKYETKGDANDRPDSSLVEYEDVIGTPVLNTPLVGYIISFVKQPPGLYMAVSSCVIMFLISVISAILESYDNKSKKNRRN